MESITYTIFVPDKDDKETQIITVDGRDGWSGISIPRLKVNSCPFEEFSLPGVYFLLCGSEGKIESIYVGESGNVKDRLSVHINSYNRGQEKFYWHTALAFTNAKLDTAKTKYLECRWFDIFTELGNYKIETDRIYRDTLKTKPEQSAMEKFIEFIKSVLPKMKYELIFDNKIIDDETVTLFYAKSTAIKAVAYLSNKGMTVLKGSQVADVKPSLSKGYVELRNKLVVNGIIKDGIFTQDYEFTDKPSQSSSIVLGRASSGNDDWVTEDGIKLGEYLAKIDTK